MSITAGMVSELRTKTGAGMMDCKKALTEAAGDMDKAVEILRKKGLAAAAKKSGRIAAEGMVVAAAGERAAALVEVNAETDFVAKNETFQEFCAKVADVVLSRDPADLDGLLALPCPATSRTIAEELTHLVATIGENMAIRRFVRFAVAQGAVVSYIHGAGKIGTLVELATTAADARVTELARQLAMHVAAASPQYLTRAEVPAAVIAQEKDIMRVKAQQSGKPENIIEKIVEGQLNKFYGEVCLLEQAFVIDPDQTVTKVLAALGKELGSEIKLTRFARLQLGEGIEKKADNFAEEVAQLSK